MRSSESAVGVPVVIKCPSILPVASPHTRYLTTQPTTTLTAGNPATVYDMCVHPEAAALAQGDERLRLTLMDIATAMIGKCEGRGPGEQKGWRILDGKRSDGMPVVGGVKWPLPEP